jgi:exopolysaccharide biosynthesis protein
MVEAIDQEEMVKAKEKVSILNSSSWMMNSTEKTMMIFNHLRKNMVKIISFMDKDPGPKRTRTNLLT